MNMLRRKHSIGFSRMWNLTFLQVVENRGLNMICFFPLENTSFWIKKCVKLLHLSPGHISFKKRFIKIENYHGSYKNGTIKVQWCRTCWWTRAAVPVTGGPFFSGLPPGRGSYVPGGNRNGCHRGGNRTSLQAWLTISGEHGAALTPPPEVTSVSLWGGGATVIRLGRTGRTAAPCVYGVSTSQTSRVDELVSVKITAGVAP